MREPCGGISVVTLTEAQRLGRVDDVLFETRPLRVMALVVRGQDEDRAIAFSDVSSIGSHAIVVESRPTTEDVRRSRDGHPGLAELEQFKVLDEAGTYWAR
jgi:uncharacterized protein YrrD